MELSSEWDDKSIEDLKEHLSRIISPFQKMEDFNVWIKPPGEKSSRVKIESPEFLSNPPYRIKGQIDKDGNLDHYTYQFSKPGQKRRELSDDVQLWGNRKITRKEQLNEELSCGCKIQRI